MLLEQQYDAILACCSDLTDALRPPCQLAVIGECRMRLAGLLHGNLTSEEAQLNGPIRRLPVGNRPRLFGELATEATRLRTHYSEHVGRWSLAAIKADHTSYAEAVGRLIHELKVHLLKKRRLLPEWRKAIG